MNPSIVEHTAGPASPAKSQVQSGAANTAAALHVESYTTNRGNVAPSAKTGSPSETQVQSGADNTSAQSQATLSAINPSNAEQAAETAGPSKTQPSDETASSSSSDEALAPSTEAYQGAAAGLALSVPEVAVIMALAMLCGLVPAL
ncbi:hypothetical protein BJ546DRAFT_1059302 [Cryomyces antarcticus]|uniref:Uncharacterized protein n=1 Tax=Cryomyces antarcticus TaxID=329879 RepID=A0ABR0KQQ9_9PEZI|nr:hypothetical protein LTR60_006461 [Cryomyces antarcticus]KAK5108570.1 hypothetical protein LTR16_006017 [Cryomyces antarcticus]KAK5157250.1 hypothetical protein LTR04_005431 [Oleoguttula sp. CCFEE 6159]